MRKWVALALGVLVPLLGLAGVGSAQSTVQVQGTIQAVDCQQGTVVVATPDSINTIAVAPYTAVLVDSQAVSLCDLQQYVGSQATVWLVPSGNEFVATRIDTTTQAAVAPVVLPAQQEAVSPLPILGVVLGTIILAGLIYLLVRDSGGHYWRYPYYGEYHRYYYRPEYRVYAGPYPAVCPVVFAAAPLVGVVLGITVFSGLEYLVVRDRDGRYERYPYYGPYRSYYYRPEYRAYSGPYRGDVPVHYGDTRGSVVFHRMDGAPYQRPVNDPRPVQYQQPYTTQPGQYQQYPRPNYTPVPPRPNDNYRGPQQYQQTPPQYQQYPRPNYTPVPPRPNDNYRGPQQYQQTPPQYQQYPRPNYTPVPPRPNDNYRGPQQYQQTPPQYQQYPRPNYTPVPPRPNDNYRGPQQYQQQQPYNPQRPQQYQQQQYQRSNYTPTGNGNSNDGRSRGRDTRQTCQSNGQSQSCSDGTHNR